MSKHIGRLQGAPTVFMFVILYANGGQAQSVVATPRTILVERAAEAADCPNASELSAGVRRLTDRSLLSPAPPNVAADLTVRIEPFRTGYHASVAMLGRDGTREIVEGGPGCHSLRDALLVAIAVLLDHELEPHATSPSTLPMRPPELPRIAQRAQPSAPPAHSDFSLDGSLRAAAGLGLLAGPAYGATLSLPMWFAQLWGIEPGVALFQQAPRVLGTGQLDLSLFVLSMHACRHLWEPWGGARASGCAVFEGGVLHGATRGFFDSGEASRPWYAAGLSATLSIRLSSWIAWSTRADLLTLLRDESFQIEGLGLVYEPHRASVVFSTGLDLSVW